MINLIKKLRRFLFVWDGLWSVPLAIIFFVITGIVMQYYFSGKDGEGAPGFYDPSFIQAAAYTVLLMVIINFIVFLGLYFNFRGLFRYFVGYGVVNGQVQSDFRNDLKALTPWQRTKLGLLFYSLLSLIFLVVFKVLV